MSTEVILEEVKTYKGVCNYREGCTTNYNTKAYTFGAYEPHIPGEANRLMETRRDDGVDTAIILAGAVIASSAYNSSSSSCGF